MTEAEAEAAIKAAIKTTTWPGVDPPVIFENVDQPRTAEYVHVFIQFPEGVQETMGPVGRRRHNYRGTVFIACHTAMGAGTARALALSDAVRETLESKTIGSVRFHAAYRADSGKAHNGASYFVATAVPFDYDDHK